MLESIIIKTKQVLMSSFPDTSFLALTKLLDSDSTSLPADVLWDSFVTHSSGSPSKSCLKCQKKTVKKKTISSCVFRTFSSISMLKTWQHSSMLLYSYRQQQWCEGSVFKKWFRALCCRIASAVHNVIIEIAKINKSSLGGALSPQGSPPSGRST